MIDTTIVGAKDALEWARKFEGDVTSAELDKQMNEQTRQTFAFLELLSEPKTNLNHIFRNCT